MSETDALEHKLRALRAAFDHSFAEGMAPERPAQLDFLVIHVAGDPHALRLVDIQSLHVDRKLVVAPSPLPGFLGMAGFRGLVTPVYDLPTLLGYGARAAPKWLVVARHESPIAFAFDEFECHLRLAAEHISTAEAGLGGAVSGAVRHGARTLPLLHLPTLIEDIARRIAATEPSQER